MYSSVISVGYVCSSLIDWDFGLPENVLLFIPRTVFYKKFPVLLPKRLIILSFDAP